MANNWGSVQLAPTLMGTTVMDGAAYPSPPLHSTLLHNQTHFLLQLWIINTHTHIRSLLFGVEKVQVVMNVCGVLCVMWLFSTITFFNERKMEAFKKMAAALLKGSIGDLMRSKSVCLCVCIYMPMPTLRCVFDGLQCRFTHWT